MRVGGILWGRRPPSAGGGPVLRRRPAPVGGWPPPQHLSSFRRFLIANGIRAAADFIAEREPHPAGSMLGGRPNPTYTISWHRVSFWAAASAQRALAAAPHVPLPIQKPFPKIWYRVTRRAPKGHGTWMYDPPSPRPSPPLRRGERVEKVGGCNTKFL
jgi:hypothetical protein